MSLESDLRRTFASVASALPAPLIAPDQTETLRRILSKTQRLERSLSVVASPSQRRPRVWKAASVAAAAASLAAVGVWLTMNGSRDARVYRVTPVSSSTVSPPGAISSRWGDDPFHPGYSQATRISLSTAQESTSFRLILPATQFANEANLTGVYELGGGAVALDFPPATSLSQPDVRQEFIEVYEAAWEGGDPVAFLQADNAASPDPYKSITNIDGVPALVVLARSPNDDDQANPAFVRFVVDGTEVQISGGDDLDLLEQIASSIIEASKS